MTLTRNNLQIIFFSFLLAIFLFSACTVEARTVVRTGEQVSLSEDQRIEGDLYVAATTVNISGEVEEDLIATGGSVTLNGVAGLDAVLVGGRVDVYGTVGDDLRVIGADIVIAEPVIGDVLAIGSNVTVLSTASIGGDLILFSGVAEVNGPVGGDVFGRVESLRVDTSIGGVVDVTTDNLVLGDNAVIVGNVIYESQSELLRAQNAQVDGEVVRNDPVLFEDFKVSLESILVPALVLLFSAAVWFLLSRRSLTRVTGKALSISPRPAIIGFVALFFGPIAITILLVSVLGTLVGMVLLFSYLLFLVLTLIAASAVLGTLAQKLFGKSKPLNLLTLVIGSVLYSVCLTVPIVGPIILVGIYVLLFGSLIDLLLQSNRS